MEASSEAIGPVNEEPRGIVVVLVPKTRMPLGPRETGEPFIVTAAPPGIIVTDWVCPAEFTNVLEVGDVCGLIPTRNPVGLTVTSRPPMVITSEDVEPPAVWGADIVIVLEPMIRRPLWPSETETPSIEMACPPGETVVVVSVVILEVVIEVVIEVVAVGAFVPLGSTTKPAGLAVIVIPSRAIVVEPASGIVLAPMTSDPPVSREIITPDTVIGAPPGLTVRALPACETVVHGTVV